MGNELKELLKEEMGMFSRVVILLWKIQPPHTQSSTIYVCMHAAILQCLFCHTIAYAITVDGVCLHLLVPPLAQCCFFGGFFITACILLA